MAEEKKPTAFEGFVAETDKLQDLGLALKQFNDDPRASVNNAASEKVRKTAYEYAKAYKLTDLPFEQYVRNEEAVSEHIGQFQQVTQNSLANRMTGKSLESLVKSIDSKTLDAIIGSELNPDNDRAILRGDLLGKDNADVVTAYQKKSAIDAQVKRFKEKKFASEDEQKMYFADAADGYALAQEKFFIEKTKGEKGHSKKLIEALKDQARKAVLRGHITDEKKLNEYAVKAAEVRLGDADKKYKEITEKKKTNAYEIARGAIKKAAENPNTDVFNQLTSTLYSAYKGTR